MSYSFNPMTDEELDAMDIVPQGIYGYEVIKSTRKTSKAGNPMAELQLRVWDNDGKIHIIFDYLVFSQINLNIKKISRFSKSVGLHEEYKKGNLPEELEGYCGKLEIGIQEERPKEGGGFYPKKNVVLDYVITDKSNIKHISESQGHADLPFDDSVPF